MRTTTINMEFHRSRENCDRCNESSIAEIRLSMQENEERLKGTPKQRRLKGLFGSSSPLPRTGAWSWKILVPKTWEHVFRIELPIPNWRPFRLSRVAPSYLPQLQKQASISETRHTDIEERSHIPQSNHKPLTKTKGRSRKLSSFLSRHDNCFRSVNEIRYLQVANRQSSIPLSRLFR